MPLTKNRSYAVSAAQLRRTIFRSDRDVFVEPLSLRPSHYTAGRQDRNQSRQILEPIESRVILTWLVFFLLLVCMLEMRAVVQNTHTPGVRAQTSITRFTFGGRVYRVFLDRGDRQQQQKQLLKS